MSDIIDQVSSIMKTSPSNAILEEKDHQHLSSKSSNEPSNPWKEFDILAAVVSR